MYGNLNLSLKSSETILAKAEKNMVSPEYE